MQTETRQAFVFEQATCEGYLWRLVLSGVVRWCFILIWGSAVSCAARKFRYELTVAMKLLSKGFTDLSRGVCYWILMNCNEISRNGTDN